MRIWSRARELAEKTPADRNRYVDFLRAASILFVISGHWLIATFYYREGQIIPGDILSIKPWTQWLTWVFQVMPIFFIVGGYSNAVSLESAKRRGINYSEWFSTRLNRLIFPLLLLIGLWAVFSFVLHLFGARREIILFASKASMIPIWFLAIYTVIVMLAPVAYSIWLKWGFYSFWVFVLLAALADFAFFGLDCKWLGWSNYFWVWFAVHHLGFAWRDNKFGSPSKLAFYSLISLGVLLFLVIKGPYPVAMAGSPGDDISNTLPPKAILILLGIFQFGLLLSIEKPMQNLLGNISLWTATVIVNSMIMTIYLWHVTVMIIVVSLFNLVEGVGLSFQPGSVQWWYSRPLWIAGLTTVLIPVALLLSGFERRGRNSKQETLSIPRLICGTLLICIGVAVLAMLGFDGNPYRGIDVLGLIAILTGAGMCRLLVIR